MSSSVILTDLSSCPFGHEIFLLICGVDRAGTRLEKNTVVITTTIRGRAHWSSTLKDSR